MDNALPYGSWPSTLTAEAVSVSPPRIDGASFVGNDLWWAESVPAESGRTAVRRRQDGNVVDVLPAPWNARSQVHEYGGGAWAASPAGALFFVERTDQRIWMLTPGAEPRPLTPEAPGVSHGGLRWSGGYLLAVRESHSDSGVARREIIRVSPTHPHEVDVLTHRSDFVAQPTLSADGTHLAWIGWNHPNLPWDHTNVFVGAIVDGQVNDPVAITSGRSAALQPEWAPDGSLLYLDDTTGRWNIWRHTSAGAPVEYPADADTGGPLWVLGTRWYAPLDDGRLLAVRTNGDDQLVVVSPDQQVIALLPQLTAGVVVEDVRGSTALVSGAGPHIAPGLWLVDLDNPDAATAIRGGSVDSALPTPRPVTYSGPHGPVHAIDYAPSSSSFHAPADELLPYVVFVHGGPTSHVSAAASAKVAFLTSRGIGVLDVNYGGSTGYGRAYRERLRGQWGIVDVDDIAAATAGLIAEGLADPHRIAIAGGSAGGWTVLSALVQTELFAAGVSRYGVADARALAADTHDFESRYLDGLIGPLPEAEDTYVLRSPLSKPERFRVPVLLLQGAEDRVVPPAQSEAIRDALLARGVPHAYVLYEGEGHGFRRAETIVDALERELGFLGAVFGFDAPGIPPLSLQ